LKFRPCIDIHNGKVKQIVGGSLKDIGNVAEENFVSDMDGGFYGDLYRRMDLPGGHIILLNPAGSEYYEADVREAEAAIRAYPGGLMIGGGITADNAKRFIDMGASHVIVTSYVFKDGVINFERLDRLKEAVGRENLVLDLSARKKDGRYYIVTDRWQKFTDTVITEEVLDTLMEYSSEYLVHAVDVEGKASGIETELARLLANWGKLPITYAGGVGSFEDLELLKKVTEGKLDVTIGSALSLFGGSMDFNQVVDYCRNI